MACFDYGGVDIGAAMLLDKARRELARGELSDATLAHLAANQIPPPVKAKRKPATARNQELGAD